MLCDAHVASNRPQSTALTAVRALGPEHKYFIVSRGLQVIVLLYCVDSTFRVMYRSALISSGKLATGNTNRSHVDCIALVLNA